MSDSGNPIVVRPGQSGTVCITVNMAPCESGVDSGVITDPQAPGAGGETSKDCSTAEPGAPGTPGPAGPPGPKGEPGKDGTTLGARAARSVLGNSTAQEASVADIPLATRADADAGSTGPNASNRLATLDIMPHVAFPTPKRTDGTQAWYLRSPVERSRDGHISMLDNVPQAQRTNVMLGTFAGDCQPFIQGLLDAGENVVIPASRAYEGSFPIKNRVALARQYQSLIGEHYLQSKLRVTADANLGVAGYLGTNHNCHINNVGITFDQNSAADRSNLIQFPAAIDMASCANSDLRNLYVAKAMTGIVGNSNCGNTTMENIRVGALNMGTQIDGPLGWIKLNNYDFWPYGITTDANLMRHFSDGSVYGLDVGRCESMAFGTIASFLGRVRIRKQAYGAQDGLPFGNIASLSLDGNSAILEHNAGRTGIGVLYSTKNSGDPALTNKGLARSIIHLGGELGIGYGNFDGLCETFDVLVAGETARFTMGAGHVSSYNTNYPWAIATQGGVITLGSGVEIKSNLAAPTARGQPFIIEDGTGRVVSDASFPVGNGQTGTAIAFLGPLNPNSRGRPNFGGLVNVGPAGATREQYGI